VANQAPPATPAPTDPALIEVYRPARAELDSGPVAKVVREFKVELEGKTYRLRVGDVFPVGGVGRNEVRLAVGMEEISVPPGAVEISDPKTTAAAEKPSPPAGKGRGAEPPGGPAEPSEEEGKKLFERSQAAAMRKYPALGERGSPENHSFLEAAQELKLSGQTSFFDDPEWPMRLADQLAAREGWGDKPKPGADRPGPADQPKEEPPPAEAPETARTPPRAGEEPSEQPAVRSNEPAQ
jgi:hypothetical protein